MAMKKKREFVDYYEYINSDQWKDRRKRFMLSKAHRSKCRICDTRKNIHIHHKSYKSLGDEKDYHLIALCAYHHKDLHNFHDESTHLSLSSATDRYIHIFGNSGGVILTDNERKIRIEQYRKTLKKTSGRKKKQKKRKLSLSRDEIKMYLEVFEEIGDPRLSDLWEKLSKM